MSETKKCTQCGQEKPIEDFSKSYKNLCKACVVENERLKRKVNKAYGCPEDMQDIHFLSYGRGIEVSIPEDAVFINPMRFQASVAAMQGLLAGGMKNNTKGYVAFRAVEIADDLLNELNKNKDENNQ